jgi:lipoprotein-anchoring transpeptidase ErfK/SrfK
MRRAPLVVATAIVALLAARTAAPATSSSVAVAPTQKLATLRVAHVARARPDAHAPPVESVQPRRPITGERTVLPVLGHARGPQGVPWLHVRLPGRPNGHSGWIRESGTTASTTAWAVVVRVERRQVTVYGHGRRARTFSAVVGKPSTPTPRGRFFVEETFRIVPGVIGGPFALALSARSNVYQEFDGGPGQIALHGVYGIGGTPGTAVSHGCIRLASSDMAWLGTHIAPGVPVTITN